ncbi:MAG: hypothetical protein ABSF83_00940 [Nitrososphaerales archaeon]|jgi:hypothetical protein
MAADAAELRRLTNEFKGSPGFRVHSEINNEKRVLRMVSRNRDELVQSLASLRREAASSPQGAENPALALAVEEVARRLESFVSSAYEAIDHTRRHCRKLYGETEPAKEIQSEIDRRFTYEPEFKLAQGLRAVSPHVDSLLASLVRGQDVPFRIRVKQLQAWDEWNDNQRRMLESLKEDVDVQALSEGYFMKIEAFYSWLWKRRGEIHSSELAEAEELRLRAKEAYDRVFPPGA